MAQLGEKSMAILPVPISHHPCLGVVGMGDSQGRMEQVPEAPNSPPPQLSTISTPSVVTTVSLGRGEIVSAENALSSRPESA